MSKVNCQCTPSQVWLAGWGSCLKFPVSPCQTTVWLLIRRSCVWANHEDVCFDVCLCLCVCLGVSAYSYSVQTHRVKIPSWPWPVGSVVSVESTVSSTPDHLTTLFPFQFSVAPLQRDKPSGSLKCLCLTSLMVGLLLPSCPLYPTPPKPPPPSPTKCQILA